MRDDFPEDVKRILASRVGNICSNPDCRVSTSGPQINLTRALNVGVAVQITSAAEGDPRHDSSLATEQRRQFSNAIWLCQTCAKLIDNDENRYTEKLLRAWKEVAEFRALGVVGQTAIPLQESEDRRKLRAISPWKGKIVTLSQMATGNAVVMLGPVRGSSLVEILDCTEFYVMIGQSGNDCFSRSILLANIDISFDAIHNCLELQERHS